MFSLLGNAGATLCFGTNLNRHIGIHALNYDSCTDGNVCDFIKSRPAFSDSKNKSDYSNFQINLNKIPLLDFNESFHYVSCNDSSYNFNIFKEKHNKTNWDIYDSVYIKREQIKLKSVIIVI